MIMSDLSDSAFGFPDQVFVNSRIRELDYPDRRRFINRHNFVDESETYLTQLRDIRYAWHPIFLRTMFFVQKGNAEDTLSRQTPSPAMQVALFLLTKISS